MYKRTLEFGGIVAEVEVRGGGPDVVLVGGGTPMTFSRPAAESLSALGFRVTDFDYGSGFEHPEPRTMLDQVEYVLAVMDGVEIDRASLVGLSRGAMTTYAIAADHSYRVSSLVLAFPVSGHTDTLFSPVDEPDTFDGLLSYVFSKEFLDESREYAAELLAPLSGAVTRVPRSEEEPFREGSSVSCPVLVIEGGADQVVSRQHPRRYVAAVEGARHVVVPGAQHGWLVEQPESFARLIAEFFAG